MCILYAFAFILSSKVQCSRPNHETIYSYLINCFYIIEKFSFFLGRTMSKWPKNYSWNSAIVCDPSTKFCQNRSNGSKVIESQTDNKLSANRWVKTCLFTRKSKRVSRYTPIFVTIHIIIILLFLFLSFSCSLKLSSVAQTASLPQMKSPSEEKIS